jgi:hypothetical protein
MTLARKKDALRSKCFGLICAHLALAGLVMASTAKQASRELRFEIIGEEVEYVGEAYGSEENQHSLLNPDSAAFSVFVIKTDEAWRKLAQGAIFKHSGSGLNISKRPDFSNQMVIAVGTFHVGGITGQGRSREAVVSKIVETNDRLVVHVRDGEERIGGGCIGQLFFYLVKLARSDKTILLIRDTAPN